MILLAVAHKTLSDFTEFNDYLKQFWNKQDTSLYTFPLLY